MSEKFQNKYRISSTRLQTWNYGWNAPYFVTICTKNRAPYFGHISDGVLNLSEIGEIVYDEWVRTFELRADMNLIMDEFIVMPNHFHGIIIIGNNEYNERSRSAMHGGSTNVDASCNTFGPQCKNLASIIRGFKSAVTIKSRKMDAQFAWQTRFYDHIIRDDTSLARIRNYIINNPKKWNEDKFYNHSLK